MSLTNSTLLIELILKASSFEELQQLVRADLLKELEQEHLRLTVRQQSPGSAIGGQPSDSHVRVYEQIIERIKTASPKEATK